MAFAALQTGPKLNMVQVAGFFYYYIGHSHTNHQRAFLKNERLLYCLPGRNGSHQACCRRTHHLQQPTNKEITFWSDSLSALQALSNKIHNNKSINDCHKALTKLADESTVHLKWIKAHTGHWGNEKADELAKAGTVSSNLVCSLVPLNHIKNMINDKVNSLTHKRWNTNIHAHTDLILGNHHTKTLKILTKVQTTSTMAHGIAQVYASLQDT